MPIVEVCNGYIFGAEGGIMGHQINKNISFLDIAHYDGLKYVVDCKLYKMVYDTESFSGQCIGLTTPTPTISDNPKLISFSLSLSKDSFPSATWQFQSFPLGGSCGIGSLPELQVSASLGSCSWSINSSSGGFDGIDSCNFSEQLELITKEVGSGGDGGNEMSPLSKFGFVIAKQISRKMSLSLSKDPGDLNSPISAEVSSADGGTSCHISQALIDGIGKNYASDNFASFDVSLSAQEPYS